MNWNNIERKYPKAFGLYNNFANKLEGLCKLRDLYDFFDEQEIYISICNYIANPVKFDFYIQIKFTKLFAGEDYDSKDLYKTRIEAEEKAFEKAFEILEEKLIKILREKE